ncbi:MAG: hypothetical protein IAF94_21475 [Pirellulaceae bacterium]|nr:hypothetical protein [Pirellulaceae bacterium]
MRPNANTFWPARLIIVFLLTGPIYAGAAAIAVRGLFELAGAAERFDGALVYLIIALSYLMGVSLAGFQMYFEHVRRAARQLEEAERELAFRQANGGDGEECRSLTKGNETMG